MLFKNAFIFLLILVLECEGVRGKIEKACDCFRSELLPNLPSRVSDKVSFHVVRPGSI